MSARLVRIEHGRPLQAFALEAGECVIGRDPGADVVLDFPRVSRQHAVVRALGDRHAVADLGSSNGTTVNGAPVREAVVLRPGDLLELGGDVALLYETGAPRPRGLPRAVLAAALCGVLLAAGAGAWWLLQDGAAELDPESVALAQKGLVAARDGDPGSAVEHLQHAAFLLFRRGFLDDVSRDEAQRVGLQRLGERLEGEPDLWSVYQSAVEASLPRPPPGRQEQGCRLDQVRPQDLDACLRERIELVMAGLHQQPEEIELIPEDFHRQVGERLRREHGFLSSALARGRPLVPKLKRALEAENMPAMLHYLALIESGYNPDAVSPAKAMGLWQFMPATARQYGLRVGGGRDERRDVDKSTHAAVRYLKGLAFEFGGDALLLALAGYNRGENGVRRALKKLDDPFADRSYWRLVERDLLPHETAMYVARFMAAAVAGEGGLPDVEVLEAAGY